MIASGTKCVVKSVPKDSTLWDHAIGIELIAEEDTGARGTGTQKFKGEKYNI